MPLNIADVLKDILDRRARDEADVRTSRVVGRNHDGTTLLQRLDGECIARGGTESYYPGQVVQHLAGGAFNGVGASGIALLSLRSSARFLFVESLEPDLFAQGEALTVIVRGIGFTETLEFQFLLPDSEEVNPDITILDQRLLDPNTLELDLEVAPEASIFERAALAYDDTGTAPSPTSSLASSQETATTAPGRHRSPSPKRSKASIARRGAGPAPTPTSPPSP